MHKAWIKHGHSFVMKQHLPPQVSQICRQLASLKIKTQATLWQCYCLIVIQRVFFGRNTIMTLVVSKVGRKECLRDSQNNHSLLFSQISAL